VKGPAAKLMTEVGLAPSAAGVAAYYGDLIDGFAIDQADSTLAQVIRKEILVSTIVMRDGEDRARLAREILAWVKELTA
jgi:LPPG:FO 2-phospho-L-lactate transferase